MRFDQRLTVRNEAAMAEKYEASYLKLARAARHYAELEARVAQYIADEPLELVWSRLTWTERFEGIHPPDAQLAGLVANVRNPIPPDLSPIIGDVVHNLRSALDIMMCEELGASASKTHTICFPMWRDLQGKPSAMAKSGVAAASNELQQLVEAWEPFSGSRSGLFDLHELWNRDKHRAIIPIMTGAQYSQCTALCGHMDEVPIFDPFPARIKVWNGKLLIATTAVIAPPIGTKIPCVCGLALDPTGWELLQALKHTIEIVEGVLISFEEGLLPEFSPPSQLEPAVIPGGGGLVFPSDMSPQDVDRWWRENSGRIEDFLSRAAQ